MHVAEPGRKRAARSFGNHLAPRAADTPRQLDPRYTDYASQPKTRPICEQCLDDGEREIAAGITSYVPCYGCGRPMAPLVPGFRRTTCSPACAMRVERRRLPKPQPPPTQTCPRCGHKFIPKHRDKALYCRPRCRHRAKDDRRLALERANRTRPRLAHPAAHAGRRGQPS